MLLLGVSVSVLSIATDAATGLSGTGFLNPLTLFGTVTLFASTVAATVTYTATNLRTGVSAKDIREQILDEAYDLPTIETELAKAYASWIDHNYRKNVQNVPLLTVTLLLALVSITYLLVGAMDALTGVGTWATNVPLVVLFALIAGFSGLFGQLRRWHRETAPDERMLNWLRSWSERI